MWYMGSKSKISKDIVPIIQSYINESTMSYVEPFVGGCNVIDKIKCNKKIGADINRYLIELLIHARDCPLDFPKSISQEEYMDVKNNKERYDTWYVGLVGFCASFGAKFFGGYARNAIGDNSGVRAQSAINNILKQSTKIQDVELKCCSYSELNILDGSVIYCDIPYKGTTDYSGSKFDYNEFYTWCIEMSKNNVVLISEYSMPDEFECIYEKKVTVELDSNRKSKKDNKERTEKIYIVRK